MCCRDIRYSAARKNTASIYLHTYPRFEFFWDFMDAVPTVLSKRRETLAIEACPLHISIWKRSRMLLKKFYFIVLFVFRLMSIKYTLTCVPHMWTCNTTWNINNEKCTFSYSSLFFEKIHCCRSSKEGVEVNLFLIIVLKQIMLIINIIVYTSMMKKPSYDLSSTT